MKPYLHEVSVEYRRPVIIYAESEAESERLLSELCASNAVPFTSMHVAETNSVCSGEASPSDFLPACGAVFTGKEKPTASRDSFYVTEAIRLISQYYRHEFGAEEKVDISDLTKISIAGTSYEEDEYAPVDTYSVDVFADLINCKFNTYVDDILVSSHTFASLEQFCDQCLTGLTFDSLVSIELEEWLVYLGEKLPKQNGFYNARQVSWLRDIYTEGQRLQLIEMVNDPQPIEPGSLGTVEKVGDAGFIEMHWDSGRSLSLVPGVDRFKFVSN